SGGKGAFRMDIERAFSVKGHGTVVTGIPASGALAVGDEAELRPPGEPTTVRAVQTYKYSADAAVEGACAAINVRDIPVEAVSRGMTLVAKGAFGATSALLAAVTNASESVKLKRITEIKFHCGTAGVNASLRLIGARSLGPGEEAFAEVRLAEPLVVAAGDRFILRTHSPSNTVGGGTVLSPRSGKLKASSPALHRRLERARDAVRAGDRLASALLAGPSALIETDDLLRLTQARRGDARKIVAEREKKGDVVSLGGDAWLVRARQDEVVAAVKAGLARYHREHKYALGMRPEQTARLLSIGEKCGRGLAAAVAEADPAVIVKRGSLALASFSPALSAQQAELREKIVHRVAEAGTGALARGNLATELGASEADMKLLVRLLAEEGEVTVLGNWLVHTPVFEDCRAKLLGLFETSENVEMSPFRKATGTSRNLAVAILEQFDSEGLTRRSGKGRILLRRPERNA
ncbi:MAG: SelB domain-containing protein, partial [Planctomycetota bacterium]